MDSPPRALRTYRTIDMQTGGEPVRIVRDGFPKPRGDTVLAADPCWMKQRGRRGWG